MKFVTEQTGGSGLDPGEIHKVTFILVLKILRIVSHVSLYVNKIIPHTRPGATQSVPSLRQISDVIGVGKRVVNRAFTRYQ